MMNRDVNKIKSDIIMYMRCDPEFTEESLIDLLDELVESAKQLAMTEYLWKRGN